jgi:hypothetical protein
MNERRRETANELARALVSATWTASDRTAAAGEAHAEALARAGADPVIAAEVIDELARLAVVATLLYSECVDIAPERGLADLFAKVESLRGIGPG